MKARLAITIAAVVLLFLPAMAQNPPRFTVHMNGWGGFGFAYTNSSWGNLGDSYQNLNSDFGLNANGYLYDPRLVDYDVSVAYDRGSFAVDQGSSSVNGLNVSGNLSFLPDRSFPFSVYFSRTNSGYNSDLVAPYENVQRTWGFRGAIKNFPAGLVNYNFSSGETDSTVTSGPTYQDRYRTGDVSLTRTLKGWQLRAGDDYSWSTNNISDFTQTNNTILVDASRTFHGDRIRLDVNQLYSTFSFQQPGSTQSDNSTLSLSANMSWKHTEKLDSYYNFTLAHNAVNELALLTAINNVDNPLPFNPLVSDTTTENFGAGASYRMRPSLTLGASLGFSHNSAPPLSSLTPSVLPSFTTGSMNVGGSASYRRKLWKLMYSSTSMIMLQRFTTLANADLGSGVGFSFDNGISGGDVRKLHFNVSYRYSHRSNPVFFNASTTTDNLATGQVETGFFRFAHLQAMVDYGTTEIDLFNSNLKLHRNSFMVMASRSKLSLFFARNSSDSNDRFFGPDSLLLQQQQQNSNLPPNLFPPFFNPLVLTEISSTRLGVLWRPKSNLQVEGRYAKYDDVFLLPQQTAYRYSQIEALASYKFGRFTMYGGYGHATSLGGLGSTFNQSVNRILFTVRFPFHVM